MPTLVLLSNVLALLNAVAAAVAPGSTFALPSRATQVTWQTVYGTAPASITIQLQISMDGTNWSTVDSSTNVNGEAKTVQFNAPFVRGNISAITGGTTVSLLIDARDL